MTAKLNVLSAIDCKPHAAESTLYFSITRLPSALPAKFALERSGTETFEACSGDDLSCSTWMAKAWVSTTTAQLGLLINKLCGAAFCLLLLWPNRCCSSSLCSSLCAAALVRRLHSLS